MRELNDIRVVSMIETIDKDALITPIKERLGVETLATVIMIFDSDVIYEYDEIVRNFIGGGSYSYAPTKLVLYVKNR